MTCQWDSICWRSSLKGSNADLKCNVSWGWNSCMGWLCRGWTHIFHRVKNLKPYPPETAWALTTFWNNRPITAYPVRSCWAILWENCSRPQTQKFKSKEHQICSKWGTQKGACRLNSIILKECWKISKEMERGRAESITMRGRERERKERNTHIRRNLKWSLTQPCYQRPSHLC